MFHLRIEFLTKDRFNILSAGRHDDDLTPGGQEDPPSGQQRC